MSLRRLGPVQLAIVTLVNKGVKDFDEIVKILSSLSIPKSSIYTAVDELQKKNIIVVTIAPDGRKIIRLQRIDTRGLIGLKKKLVDRLKNIMLLLSIVAEEPSDYSGLDPAVLEGYKRFLEKELEKVEKALSKWKKVSIE
ncbi:hypothetical protein J4526_06900 [Desulfurococcaceae archaeon MEX13E-LK6-19]|nr:hypothetical protein J4526_06900 [Desulfurococcaceae archaeon MEX13E-LK6-19]